jgi:serine/threonine protein kinase
MDSQQTMVEPGFAPTPPTGTPPRSVRQTTVEYESIGGFEVIDKLGQGGMGAVYRARQVSLGRLVALKVLPQQFEVDEEFVARFQREAKVAASLNHPNLVRVYSSGEADGCHYIAMELVEGENLRQRFKRGGMTSAEALRICTEVARGLECGWERAHLIHRDIKPSNIYLSHGGEVKLGDLGLAKSLLSNTTGLTHTGTAMGTPHYMSPEQARGEKNLDHRADIYSLGCTLFELLTGRTPYEGNDAASIIAMHLTAPAPAILKVLPNCPLPLARLVSRMMKKSRHERPANYADLIVEMEHLREQIEAGLTNPGPGAAAQAWKQFNEGAVAPVTPSPRSPAKAPTATASFGASATLPPQRKQPPVLWFAIGAVVLIVGALAFIVAKPKASPSRSSALQSRSPSPALGDPSSATKDAPFVNSLGMKFVPVPGSDILLCIHETRRKDYAAYSAAVPGVDLTWKSPVVEGKPFSQEDDHPVIQVSWTDADAFCAWLSKKEGRTYRLPTEHEWNLAVATGPEDPTTLRPEELAEKLKGRYPWGTSDLNDGVKFGNYMGNKDGFEYTAPVMSFPPNRLGIHDLGGNAWEWCDGWIDGSQKMRPLRGCGFRNVGPFINSANRIGTEPGFRLAPLNDFSRRITGFRTALVLKSSEGRTASRSQAPAATPTPSIAPQPASPEVWQNALQDPATLTLTGGGTRTTDGLRFASPGGVKVNRQLLARDGGLRVKAIYGECHVKLLARQNGTTGVYQLNLGSDQTVTLARWDDGAKQNRIFQEFILRKALKFGQEYELELRIVGTSLTAKLNGDTLGTVTDATLKEGDWGLSVNEMGTTAALLKSVEVLSLGSQ